MPLRIQQQEIEILSKQVNVMLYDKSYEDETHEEGQMEQQIMK
jgi:hypothetical protein